MVFFSLYFQYIYSVSLSLGIVNAKRRYLDWPLGMGFHCPNASEIAAFEEAVAAGDITW